MERVIAARDAVREEVELVVAVLEYVVVADTVLDAFGIGDALRVVVLLLVLLPVIVLVVATDMPVLLVAL